MVDLFGHTCIQKPRYSPCSKSGDDEWYSPPNIVEIARKTMGGIDLDPASSAEANAVVGAEKYYTKADNGMTYQWAGRVFMNPPYAGVTPYDGKKAFIAKLVRHYLVGDVSEACMICPMDFSPSWGQPIRDHACAYFFTCGNMKFYKCDDPDAQPQGNGSLVVYFGHRPGVFEETCYKYHKGVVLFPSPVVRKDR